MPPRLSEVVPGYKEAVERELTLRETAFLCDRTVLANGLRVRQFTPTHMLQALYSESPFVMGGNVQGEHLLQFLWIIRDPTLWKDEDKQRFISAHLYLLQPAPFLEAFHAIQQYMEETFMDRPAAAEVAGEHTSYYSNVAELVDIFGHEYGWEEQYILNLPYIRLYQYLRCIIARNSLEEVSFINRFSDLAAIAWAGMQNRVGSSPASENPQPTP
ncbi:hypothetical protein DB346_08150 [Verrucomicrobia bacterium LW23]|nr:hypothetical protein DB346_08150 [Verrucomicrobia bacterium LW23]